MDPYNEHCSFQNLLQSQQPITQNPYQHVPREPYQSVPREPYKNWQDNTSMYHST